MKDIELDISEIRRWMNTTLDALENVSGSSITISQDLYWSINPEQSFDLHHEPEIGTGSLCDDIEDLKKEMAAFEDLSGGMIAWHACYHLAGVLNYLAASIAGSVTNRRDVAAGRQNNA